MHRITALTIKERVVSLNPAQVFQNRSELVVHETFRNRVMPVMKLTERITRCRYESLPLGPVFNGTGIRYPRSPKNTLPRWEPNSSEIFVYFRTKGQNVLTAWEHLVFFLALQSVGQPGLLVTSGNSATFCFMRGVADEVFLVRVFWHQGMKSWFLRAWSLEERKDRGWSTANQLLLPEETRVTA